MTGHQRCKNVDWSEVEPELIRMREEEGLSYNKMSKRLGIPAQTLNAHYRKYTATGKRSGKTKKMKAAELLEQGFSPAEVAEMLNVRTGYVTALMPGRPKRSPYGFDEQLALDMFNAGLNEQQVSLSLGKCGKYMSAYIGSHPDFKDKLRQTAYRVDSPTEDDMCRLLNDGMYMKQASLKLGMNASYIACYAQRHPEFKEKISNTVYGRAKCPDNTCPILGREPTVQDCEHCKDEDCVMG